MTPFQNYENLTTEIKYKEKFTKKRDVIENPFDILKNRFFQLIKIDINDVEKINKIKSCLISFYIL